MTAIMKSVEDERIPPVKGKVRASAFIMALVCKPSTDSQGNDTTECFFATHIDINGLVPKWAVNLGARSAPT